MQKGLTIGALVVTGILLALFLVDAIVGWPYNRALDIDIPGIIAGGLIFYGAFETYREMN